MKKIKFISITLIIVVTMLFSFFTYTKNSVDVTNDLESFEKIVFLPYGGYICGFVDSKVFLQVPLKVDSRTMFDSSEIIRIILYSDDKIFETTDISFKLMKEYNSYNLFSMNFRLPLDEKGEYLIKNMEIEFLNKEIMKVDLNDMIIVVEEETEFNHDFDKGLVNMIEFQIAQDNFDTQKFAYINKSKQDVEILEITFSDNLYNKISYVDTYNNFMLEEKLSNMSLREEEEKTFLFNMEINENFSSENVYYLYRPFLIYKSNQNIYKTIASTQAIIIDTGINNSIFVH